MKKLISLFLVFVVLSGCAVFVNAEDESDYVTVDLFKEYTTAQVVAMFPEEAAYLAAELRSLSEDISMKSFSFKPEYIDSLFTAVICENPDLFYVNPRFFDTTMSVENELVSVRPKYLFAPEDIPAEIERFNFAADSVLSGVGGDWSDFLKARYLHDILAHHTKYAGGDSDELIFYTSYGALVGGEAVCEGYTLAYRFLLGRAGIKSYYIQSFNPIEFHSWALVELDNSYYHVDITHDDPSPDSLGLVMHRGFLLSDKALAEQKDPLHENYISDFAAEDSKFDKAWWHSVNTMMYRVGDTDIYIDQNYGGSHYAALKNVKDNGEGGVIKKLKTRWYVRDDPDAPEGAFWERGYSYLTFGGDWFYFNDASRVYRVQPSSDKTEIIYQKPESLDGDIYGIGVKTDGELYISVKRKPTVEDNIYRVEIGYVIPDETEPEETTAPTEKVTVPIAPTDPPGSNKSTEPTETAKSTTAAKRTVNKKVTLYLGNTCTVKLNSSKVSCKSSNTKVATVSKKGKITAKKKGKATITVTGKSTVIKVKVTVKNPKLGVTKKTLTRGSTYKIGVLGSKKKPKYSSSNKKVATVNKNGIIKAKRKGKANITVKINGIKLKCKITVK